MSESAPRQVVDLPPSAKLVYFVLDARGPLTREELLEESLLPSRTARSAMDRLEEIGVLKRKYYFEDGVQRLYELVDGAPSSEEPARAAPTDD